jgi:hypothetical protein
VETLKAEVLAEIQRIAGDCLTAEMAKEIAERAIKMIEDRNRAIALTAVETVKQTLMDATAKQKDEKRIDGLKET